VASLSDQGPRYWSARHPPIDFEKAAAWCEKKTGKVLARVSAWLMQTALYNKVIIITGGPGAGKTTLVSSLLGIVPAKGVNCLLCVPTGRAAKRMTESTGIDAKTIHRLLEVEPSLGPGLLLQNLMRSHRAAVCKKTARRSVV
jgi:exodeoxyribonuclease V alpha subunit